MENKLHDPFGHALVLMFSFFILLFVFAKWGPAINFNSTTQTAGQPFVVTGTGKATTAPDIAKVDFGIEQTGTDLKTVQNSVDQKSQSLVAQIKKLGIAASDIQTTSYQVNPQYDYTAPVQNITGYDVSTNYEVTIRDFTKINDLIATATSNGANNISGVNFDLSDTLKNQTMQTAREQAVSEAKRHGIERTHGFFLVGSPGETEEDILESFRFAARLKLDTFGFNRLCVYRGTPLWREYVGRGIIDDERDWAKWFKCSDIDPTVLPSEVVNRARQRGYALLFAHRLLRRPVQTWKLLRSLGRHMKVSDILKLLSSPFRRRALNRKTELSARMIDLGLTAPIRTATAMGTPAGPA